MIGYLALLAIVLILIGAVVFLLIQRSRSSRAESALRESETRFRLVAEHAPVMLWTARPDTSLDYLNHTAVEFSGLPMEKLIANGWLDAVHPDDRDDLVSRYAEAVEARSPFLLEYRARRVDGAWRWLLASGSPKFGPDGGFRGYVGGDIDITERKHAEDAIRDGRAALEVSHREIQLLAGRLIEAQDAERARLARDLHDDVSQQLAGLSIALSGLKHRIGESRVAEDVQADVRAIHERTSTLAHDVRQLSHDLHPTVLRHAGLVAALSSHCAELQRSHGTILSCSAEGDFASVAPEVALCLYRISQEALRNVIAHAGARRADVRLVRAGDNVQITIRDDGRGFDVASALERDSGLGLVSMRERVRLLRGTFSVQAEPSQGTRVCVEVPAHASVNTTSLSAVRGEQRELSFS